MTVQKWCQLKCKQGNWGVAFSFDLLIPSMIKIKKCGKGCMTNLDNGLACLQNQWKWDAKPNK